MVLLFFFFFFFLHGAFESFTPLANDEPWARNARGVSIQVHFFFFCGSSRREKNVLGLEFKGPFPSPSRLADVLASWRRNSKRAVRCVFYRRLELNINTNSWPWRCTRHVIFFLLFIPILQKKEKIGTYFFVVVVRFDLVFVHHGDNSPQ